MDLRLYDYAASAIPARVGSDPRLPGRRHAAGEAGVELADFPAVQGWCERVAGQEGYIDDLEPYAPNAG